MIISERNILRFSRILEASSDYMNFTGNRLKTTVWQVNLFQKLLFLHQLTHNITKDCSLSYKLCTWNVQTQNMLCSECQNKKQFVYTTCSELVIQWTICSHWSMKVMLLFSEIWTGIFLEIMGFYLKNCYVGCVNKQDMLQPRQDVSFLVKVKSRSELDYSIHYCAFIPFLPRLFRRILIWLELRYLWMYWFFFSLQKPHFCRWKKGGWKLFLKHTGRLK